MSYDVGTYVRLNADGSIARAVSTFQQALEGTEAEVGTSFTFTKEGRLARRIPVVAI